MGHPVQNWTHSILFLSDLVHAEGFDELQQALPTLSIIKTVSNDVLWVIASRYCFLELFQLSFSDLLHLDPHSSWDTLNEAAAGKVKEEDEEKATQVTTN